MDTVLRTYDEITFGACEGPVAPSDLPWFNVVWRDAVP